MNGAACEESSFGRWGIVARLDQFKGWRSIVAVSAVILAAFLYFQLQREKDVEWNPFVERSGELVGLWIESGSELHLTDDHQYTCTGSDCGEVGSLGTWNRHGDFYVELTAEGGEIRMLRMANVKPRLNLVAGKRMDADDPDLWSPRYYFAKTR